MARGAEGINREGRRDGGAYAPAPGAHQPTDSLPSCFTLATRYSCAACAGGIDNRYGEILYPFHFLSPTYLETVSRAGGGKCVGGRRGSFLRSVESREERSTNRSRGRELTLSSYIFYFPLLLLPSSFFRSFSLLKLVSDGFIYTGINVSQRYFSRIILGDERRRTKGEGNRWYCREISRCNVTARNNEERSCDSRGSVSN